MVREENGTLDRLIAKLRSLSDQSELRATLAEFDTVMVE
jgi:hypothetical protein